MWTHTYADIRNEQVKSKACTKRKSWFTYLLEPELVRVALVLDEHGVRLLVPVDDLLPRVRVEHVAAIAQANHRKLDPSPQLAAPVDLAYARN